MRRCLPIGYVTWHTPDDPNEFDSYGSDVDLHYKLAGEPWNQAPYDIMWNNQTSDWGMPGPDDDPQLLRVDDDGAGPEMVAHNNPNSSYDVGVYYYGSGPHTYSLASVRVFIDGALTYEKSDTTLSTTGMFWHVGQIDYQNRLFEPVDEVAGGFP
jgi:hypothetical protein